MCSVCGCGTDHSGVGNHASMLKPHAHTHAPDFSSTRIVEIEKDILSKNSTFAQENHAWLKARNIFALNFVSSPGSGKTSLLVKTITDLNHKYKFSVVEGDQQTDNDAQRIRATGAQAVQINTGRGCHLDAHMVGHAFEELDIPSGSISFIENVGNLICPALFGLGEDFTVAILSVTEGEDKPIKYPDIFANANLMLINKIDLLPYVDFNMDACKQYALRINPNLEILELSSKTGEGMKNWYAWLEQKYLAR